jgi:hypothetical protein
VTCLARSSEFTSENEGVQDGPNLPTFRVLRIELGECDNPLVSSCPVRSRTPAPERCVTRCFSYPQFQDLHGGVAGSIIKWVA